MKILLNKQNRKSLLELVDLGGVVLYHGYFLLSFSKEVTAGKGFWIECSDTFQGENDYSDFVKQGEEIEVFCFEPVKIPLV